MIVVRLQRFKLISGEWYEAVLLPSEYGSKIEWVKMLVPEFI